MLIDPCLPDLAYVSCGVLYVVHRRRWTSEPGRCSAAGVTGACRLLPCHAHSCLEIILDFFRRPGVD